MGSISQRGANCPQPSPQHNTPNQREAAPSSQPPTGHFCPVVGWEETHASLAEGPVTITLGFLMKTGNDE